PKGPFVKTEGSISVVSTACLHRPVERMLRPASGTGYASRLIPNPKIGVSGFSRQGPRDRTGRDPVESPTDGQSSAWHNGGRPTENRPAVRFGPLRGGVSGATPPGPRVGRKLMRKAAVAPVKEPKQETSSIL